MIGDTNAIASSSQQTVLDITVTGANNLISGGTVTVMMGDQLIAEDITDTMGKCTIQLGLTNGVMLVSYEKDGNRAEQTVNVAIGVTTQVFLTIIASLFTFTMNYNASNFVSSPNNCLTYADGCAGFTPVSGPGSSGNTPAKCTNIGSWVMNADGTSSNPLLDKCFYATFTDAGVLHEKLNPQNLKQKIATWNNSTKEWVPASGSSSVTTENTMFCIPTIYVSSTAASIALSLEVGGNPFAHTIDNHVYQYMAIGVYPVNGSSTRLKSISGATSTVSIQDSDLVAGCRANTVQNGKAILCNWFQWQLYRLLVLFSIRHFNSQEKIGQGGQTAGEKTTGLMDAMGPFAGSSGAFTGDSQGVKAFIENPWGHNAEVLGDLFCDSDSSVYAFQTSTQNSMSTTGVCITASPHSLINTDLASGSISTEPETWGWGTGSGGSATTGGCDGQFLPDYDEGPTPLVGGESYTVELDSYAGISYLNGYYPGPETSGRLVFVFDIDGEGEPVNPSEPYDLSNASYTETYTYGVGLAISISGIVVNDTSNVSKIVVVCETIGIVGAPTLSKELQKDDPNGEYTLMSGSLDPIPEDNYITSATIKVFDTSGVVIQEKQI